MSVNGKFTRILRHDLLRVADRFSIGTATDILKQVGAAINAWPDFAQSANVSPVERDRIRRYHQAL